MKAQVHMSEMKKKPTINFNNRYVIYSHLHRGKPQKNHIASLKIKFPFSVFGNKNLSFEQPTTRLLIKGIVELTCILGFQV